MEAVGEGRYVEGLGEIPRRDPDRRFRIESERGERDVFQEFPALLPGQAYRQLPVPHPLLVQDPPDIKLNHDAVAAVGAEPEGLEDVALDVRLAST